MDKMQNKYEIKRLLKSSDDGYIEALSIYSTSTPGDIKTNANEITYWLDNQKLQNKFELFLFVLYLDSEIIGFAMICYLKGRKTLIYDYIALKEQFRINVAYFAFMSLINSYIYTKKYNVDFFVIEISNKNEGKDIDKESLVFHKLLCIEGYGVVKIQYKTLPLGFDNLESSFDAFLYLRKAGSMTSFVNKSTVLNIVKGIYYDYYETWYSAFLSVNEIDSFNKTVNSFYSLIENDTNLPDNIEVLNPECVSPSLTKDDSTKGVLPAINCKPYKDLLTVLLIFMTMPILIIVFYNWILSKVNISIDSVSSIIGNALSAIMSFIIAYYLTLKKKL